MIRSRRVTYCSWIIVGLLGILLGGCATPTPKELPEISDKTYRALGGLVAVASICKSTNQIDDKTFASFTNALDYRFRNEMVYGETTRKYADMYINTYGDKTTDKCYQIHAFIEQQNNEKERIRANISNSNSSGGDYWNSNNTGTINKVPVCTKIGGSLYCN